MADSCPPVRIPAADLIDRASSSRRPSDLSWNDVHIRNLSSPGRAFRHKFLFVPREQSDDDHYTAIRASQHPNVCNTARYLLIEDDLAKAGLGYTARLLAGALLLAMRMGRVLLETPQRNATTGRSFGRWCCVPPHTLCAPSPTHASLFCEA